MMNRDAGTPPPLRYLDGEAERRALVEDIQWVRQVVLDIAQSVPQDRWYEPRYHGWTLAAMLAHLHNSDNLALLLIKVSLLGFRPAVSEATLNWINNRTAHYFRKRLIPTTLVDIRKNEKTITDFIVRLPMDKFTKLVYHPTIGEYLTVERAMQEYFLNHWHLHLLTLQKGEGIYDEPPTAGADMV